MQQTSRRRGAEFQPAVAPRRLDVMTLLEVLIGFAVAVSIGAALGATSGVHAGMTGRALVLAVSTIIGVAGAAAMSKAVCVLVARLDSRLDANRWFQGLVVIALLAWVFGVGAISGTISTMLLRAFLRVAA